MGALRRVAAIDIGSNAIRITIAEPGPNGQPRIVRHRREPIRLGRDVFSTNEILPRTEARLIRTLQRFRTLLDRARVGAYRAVATSALREAYNRELIVARAHRETGIEVELIAGEEEARLAYRAVAQQLPVQNHSTVLVDIGGGSVELALVEGGQLVSADTFKLGTVRLLHRLRQQEEAFSQLVREYCGVAVAWLKHQLEGRSAALIVGMGGNVEALAELRRRILNRDNGSALSREELAAIIERLESLDYLERIQELDLRPDRADVILPAALVLSELLDGAGLPSMRVPGVGLKDGLLQELLDEHPEENQQQQARRSVMLLGRKFDFDEEHARKVATLALALFDQTRELHGLDGQARFHLELAGLLHDVGKVVATSGHHKHSYYLIRSSPLIGLSVPQRALVACLARFHRKSVPSSRHEELQELSPQDRGKVNVLSALLRVAEALDAEHRGRVHRVKVTSRKNELQLRLEGEGSLLLETWASQHKLVPLERALGRPIKVVS